MVTDGLRGTVTVRLALRSTLPVAIAVAVIVAVPGAFAIILTADSGPEIPNLGTIESTTLTT